MIEKRKFRRPKNVTEQRFHLIVNDQTHGSEDIFADLFSIQPCAGIVAHVSQTFPVHAVKDLDGMPAFLRPFDDIFAVIIEQVIFTGKDAKFFFYEFPFTHPVRNKKAVVTVNVLTVHIKPLFLVWNRMGEIQDRRQHKDVEVILMMFKKRA